MIAEHRDPDGRFAAGGPGGPGNHHPDAEHCRRGHLLKVGGVDADGSCSACRRERKRKQAAKRRRLILRPFTGYRRVPEPDIER